MKNPIISKVYLYKQYQYDLEEILSLFREVFQIDSIKLKLSKCETILIKPNMLGAHSPEKAVTTHPIVLEACIIALKGLNKQLLVGDSPGGVVSASMVWKETGIGEICKKHGISLIDFGKEGVISKEIDGLPLYFEKKVFEVDGIVNLAKMKTHSLMLYTGAVKNFFGLIPGLYKSELHKKFPHPKFFAKVLTTLYEEIKDKILFNVLDGIVGMEGEGPSAGKPKAFNSLFFSESASSIDYLASKMMGFSLDQLDYIQEALKIENIEPLNIKAIPEKNFSIIKDVEIKEVLFRQKFLDSLPKGTQKLFNLLFNYYPYFLNSCKKCGICVKSCPMQALEFVGIAKKPTLNKSKCIKCMCCHEMCPFHAVIIKKTFLAKLFLK